MLVSFLDKFDFRRICRTGNLINGFKIGRFRVGDDCCIGDRASLVTCDPGIELFIALMTIFNKNP